MYKGVVSYTLYNNINNAEKEGFAKHVGEGENAVFNSDTSCLLHVLLNSD